MRAKGRDDTAFVCKECGYSSVKWTGKCPECQSWNSFSEEPRKERNPVLQGFSLKGGSEKPQLIQDIQKEDLSPRVSAGIEELDRVLGGGLVESQVVLLGGEPGVGKSTLLLQVAYHLSLVGKKVLYVTSEESVPQVGLRARRLSKEFKQVYILNENNVASIIGAIRELQPSVVIVDSIQTMVLPEITSAAGSIIQVREVGSAFTQIAKATGIVFFIVSHITKEGSFAGPKILEHIVDTVLYFEGDKNLPYKILRTEKNRFGPSGELGVFQMREQGFEEVKNLAEVFYREDTFAFSGIALACVMEGMRPIVVEVQSLVSRSGIGIAKRRSEGYDFNRFSLIVAIVEKRLGINLFSHDIFVNVTSGLHVNDPAADLAVAVSIASSYKNAPLPEPVICIGELGLCGELRSVQFLETRIKQAEKLGFGHCVIPARDFSKIPKAITGKLKISRAETLKDVVDILWKK